MKGCRAVTEEEEGEEIEARRAAGAAMLQPRRSARLEAPDLAARPPENGANPAPAPPPSADQTKSPIAVSKKREYFKCPPETIGDFAPEVAKFGAWRPTANLQKPAIGRHFSDY
jgi:hypothetical protein